MLYLRKWINRPKNCTFSIADGTKLKSTALVVKKTAIAALVISVAQYIQSLLAFTLLPFK